MKNVKHGIGSIALPLVFTAVLWLLVSILSSSVKASERLSSFNQIDSLAIDPPSCGKANGRIRIFASGTPPFAYRLGPTGLWQASSLFTNLSTGSHTVQVKDATNQIQSQTAVLTMQAAPSLSLSQVQHPKCGNADGFIRVQATGVAKPFRYKIRSVGSTFSSAQADSSFSNLGAGFYTIMVVDSNGCKDSIQALLQDVNSLAINTIQSTQAACNLSNGSLMILSSGGLAPIQYSIDGGLSLQTSPLFTNLGSGTYQVLVVDASGCPSQQPYFLSETNPPQIQSVLAVNDHCNDQNGQIQCIVSGGQGPYLYSFDSGASFQVTNTFYGLGPGVYPVVVKDQNGCLTSDTAQVHPGQPLSIQGVSISHYACAQNKGSIQFAPSGEGPFTYTNLGSGLSQLSPSFTSLNPGSYSFRVIDASGCSRDTTIWVNDIESGTIQHLVVAPESCGNGNGSIHVSGDTSNLYRLSPSEPWVKDTVFANLSAGTYTVYAKGLGQCTSSQTVLVPTSAGPRLSSSQIIPPNCGNQNGRIFLLMQGGNQGFSFSLNGGPSRSTPLFDSLNQGIHSILISDSLGCDTLLTFSLQDVAKPKIQLLSNLPTSCGLSNGKATYSLSGGIGPVSVFLNGRQITPIGILDSLSFGVHQVQLIDSLGCTSDTSISIQALPSIELDSLVVIPSSCTGPTGVAKVFAKSHAPLGFQLNSGAVQPTGVFTGLGTGQYAVRIIDSSGCVIDTSFSIGYANTPQIDSIQTFGSVCGQSSGSIGIFASQGNPPYQYALGNGSFSSSNQFSGLSSGIYVVRVKDSKGCEAVDTLNLNTIQALSLFGFNKLPAHCSSSNGSISLIGLNGVPPYAFSINHGPFSAQSVFDSLPAGNHLALVQDSRGCTDSLSFQIGEDPMLNFGQIQITPASCNQFNGSIQLNPIGGSPIYQIRLNGGSWGVLLNKNNLSPGAYLIELTDMNGCIIDTLVHVQKANPPRFKTISLQPEFCGANDGVAQIQAQGQGLSFSMDSLNWQQDSLFTNLKSGLSEFFIKDQYGCVRDTMVHVPKIAGPEIDSLGIAQTTCGLTNGAIVIYPSGGTPPYSFSFNGGSTWTTKPFKDSLGIGVYGIVVRDSLGCEVLESTTISPAPMPTIVDLRLQHASCGNSNGMINPMVQLGVPPYEFNLNQTGWNPTGLFQNIPVGSHQLIIRDQRGCLDTAKFSIDSISVPRLDHIAVQPSICDQPNGSLSCSITGGRPPYLLSIDGGQHYVPSLTIQGLPAGAYTISVKDSSGCRIDTSVNIPGYAPPRIQAIIPKLENCGQSDGGLTVQAQGNGPLSFSVNSITLSGNTLNNIPQGAYLIRVSDTNGCTTDTLFHLHTMNGPRLDSVQIDSAFCASNLGSAQLHFSHGLPPYTIDLNHSGVQQPLVALTGLARGWHNYTLYDSKACSYQDSFYIPGPSKIQIHQDSLVPATCNAANGSFALNMMGGTPPFSIQLNGVNQGAKTQFSGLLPGFYTVSVIDQKGCTKDTLVQVLKTNSFEIDSMFILPSSCNGANAQAIIRFTGGSPPYTYGPMSFGSSLHLSGLMPGLQHFSFTDSEGCILDTLIDIPKYPLPKIDSIFTLPEACGQADGSLSAYGNGLQFRLNGQVWADTGMFNNLNSGSQFLEYRDSTGCVRDTFISIGTLAGPNLGVASTKHASCGVPNGHVQLTSSGGTGLQFLHLNSGQIQTDSTFTNLGQGNHWFKAIDSRGCADSILIALNQFDPPSINTLDTSRNCATQSFDVNISAGGGQGSLVYRIDTLGWQNSGQFFHLSPGPHFLEIKDISGCTIDSVFHLNAIDLPKIHDVGIDHPACGNSDGRILVRASAHDSMEFILNGVSQTDSVFRNLAPGAYLLEVKSAGGCSVSQSLTLSNQPPPQVLISSIQNPACGYENGSLTISSVGANGPCLFALDSGQASIQFGQDSTFSNLPHGAYHVLAKDSNGCVQAQSISLFEINNMAITQVQGTVPFCGMTNGSIAFQANGGTPPLMYSIDSGLTLQPSGVFTQLDAGTYTLMAVDAKGCNVTQDFLLPFPKNPEIDLVESIALSCNQTNGQIRVFSSGGGPNHLFSLDGINFQSSPLFSGLQKGWYEVWVKDSRNCIQRDSVFLDSIPKPEFLSIQSDSANCLAQGGFIEVIAKGTGLLYSVDGGINLQQNPRFENLHPGRYDVQVVDSLGCFIDTQVQVYTRDLARILDVSSTPEVCGRANGQLIIHTSGMPSNYTYSIDGGLGFSSDSIFTGLTSGVYSLMVLDQTGCMDTLSFTLGKILGPEAELVSINPAHCQTNNGSVTFKAIEGSRPIFYSLNGSAFQSDSSFSNLSPGTYTLFLRDSLLCVTTLNFIVPEISNPQIDAISITPSICGEPNGAISLQGLGGLPPYQFTILPSGRTNQTGIIDSLSAGMHSISLIDSLGCTFDTIIEVPGFDAPWILPVRGDTAHCAEPNGSLVIQAVGSRPFTYSIDGGLSFQIDSVFKNLPKGHYSILVEDINGCQSHIMGMVEADYSLQGNVSIGESQEICLGDLAHFDIQMTENPDSCIWTMDDGTQYLSCDPIQHEFKMPGTFGLILEVFTDLGCGETIDFPNLVVVNPVPKADFISPFGESFHSFEAFPLANQSQDADSVAWFVNGKHISAQLDPTIKAVFNPDEEAFTICLEVWNNEGCADTYCMDFTEEKDFQYFMPNAFSPNGDGQNDEVYPVFFHKPQVYDFRILDRWGKEVFRSQEVDQPWNGSFYNSGETLKTGVYSWHLEVIDPLSGKPIRDAGTIILLQ